MRIAGAEGKGPAKTAQPLMVLTGEKSKVTKGSCRRVESAEEWKALWLEHQTGSPKPREVPRDMPFVEIDFTRCIVIAVFDGKGINCAGFKAHSVMETESQVLLRVSPSGIQSGVPGVATTAWAVFVLPRSLKPVVIEENAGARGELASLAEDARSNPAVQTACSDQVDSDGCIVTWCSRSGENSDSPGP